MAKKLVAEAIGTFFLVFTIGMVALEPGAGQLSGLAIGVVLMIMVYAAAHVSGGHLNPAVTLAVFLRRKATVAELGGYIVAQLVAATIAALLVQFLKPDVATTVFPLDPAAALLAEFLFTFALCYTVLNVATAPGNEGNSFYGFAIGGIVLVGAYAVGNISGAAFNPAVAVGVVLLGLVGVADLWIFLLANFAGGAAAALVFNGLGMGADKPTSATPAEQQELRSQAAPR
jgi:aquaporin Z